MEDERFWEKVDASGDCWEWTGYIDRDGYGLHGNSRSEYSSVMAHRIAWELLIGPIPAGHETDHLCRNRRCVNPDHLEPVTPAVHRKRTPTHPSWVPRTHCRRGHEFTPENTIIFPDGKRNCRTCSQASWRAYKRRVRAK